MGYSKETTSPAMHKLTAYGYMVAWILLSATVIMLNKYILAPDLGGFPFPLTLTSVHMLFCSVVSGVLVKLRLVHVQEMEWKTYLRCVVPIGLLFAVTLWMGNAAYMYLSVSFIQMLKAMMPMLVFSAGAVAGTEQWCPRTSGILVVVVGGVLLASHAELVFVLLGVVYQCVSMVSEATRLTLVQLLLQRRGFKLNPITTMYYVSPVCLAALLVPLASLEAKKVLAHTWQIGPGILLFSAITAFALNVSIFLLIGKTSALTMNVAGVIKDVVLVYLSMSLFGSKVTVQQIVGYGIALCGVTAYNMHKLHRAQTCPASDTLKAGRTSPSPAETTADSSDGCAGNGAYAVVKIQRQWQQQQWRPQDSHGQQGGVLRDQYTGWKLSTEVSSGGSICHKLGPEDSHTQRSAPS